jgi:hypothetical protein
MEYDEYLDVPSVSDDEVTTGTGNLKHMLGETPGNEFDDSVFDNEYFGMPLAKLILIAWNGCAFAFIMCYFFGLIQGSLSLIPTMIVYFAGNFLMWLLTRNTMTGYDIFAAETSDEMPPGLAEIGFYALIFAAVLVIIIWLITDFIVDF